jgi:hypothetical protein
MGIFQDKHHVQRTESEHFCCFNRNLFEFNMSGAPTQTVTVHRYRKYQRTNKRQLLSRIRIFNDDLDLA